MVKKLLILVVASVFVLCSSMPLVGQEKAEKAKKTHTAKQDRWEGIVQRSDKDKSTLTVRKRGGNLEKTVHYDASTQWVSQAHGSKKVNNIDASAVKDGDRVICLGNYDEKGEFHATLISKRLTNY